MSGRKKSIRVLYIMGYGRSGSTVIESMLNSHPNVIACGELEYLLERGLDDSQSCSCGQSIMDCNLWKKAAGLYKKKIEKHPDWRKVKRREERLMSVVRSFFSKKQSEVYASVESDLFYDIVNEHKELHIVIDSSKSPGRALALKRNGVDVRVLFLVRDSRAVTYSWAKKVKRPEIQAAESFMPRYPYWRSAIYWMLYNMISLVVVKKYFSESYVIQKYENIFLDPGGFITKLEKLTGEKFGSIKPKLLGEVDIPFDAHTISGNPVRFAKNIKFSKDSRWENEMNKFQKGIVTIISYPLLKVFRYI